MKIVVFVMTVSAIGFNEIRLQYKINDFIFNIRLTQNKLNNFIPKINYEAELKSVKLKV